MVAKVFRPRIDLFLSGRVPGHFTAEGIFFILPALGALSHAGFQGTSLRRHAFTLQLEENLKEDIAFHLAEDRITGRKIRHGHGRFIGMVQVPIPGMVGHQVLMIACQTVQHPVGRGNMGIIERTVDQFRCLLVPTRPAFPIQVAAIIVRGHLIGLIVEQALAHSIGVCSVFELQAAPQHAVNKLLNLCDFIFVWLAQLLHQRGDPAAGAAFVAQAGDPHSAVLHHDLVGFAVVGHDRRTAVKRILGVDEPLLSGHEVAHVRHRLGRGLDYKIVDRLDQAVAVSNGHATSSPRFAAQRIRLPAALGCGLTADRDCSLRCDGEGLDVLGVFQEEMRIDVHGQDITRDAHRHRPVVGCKGRFNIPNRIGQQELEPVGFRFARRERQHGWRVPRLGLLPFIFSIGLAMNHPIVEAFEGDAARRGIGENRRGGRPSSVLDWVVGLKRSLALRYYQERRAFTTQPCYLEITSVLADVRIIKRAERMSLFQGAVVEHVVEDHRYAQGPDRNRLGSFVF